MWAVKVVKINFYGVFAKLLEISDFLVEKNLF